MQTIVVIREKDGNVHGRQLFEIKHRGHERTKLEKNETDWLNYLTSIFLTGPQFVYKYTFKIPGNHSCSVPVILPIKDCALPNSQVNIYQQYEKIFIITHEST